MKAAVIHEGGAPEVLRLEEVPDPAPGPDQVLVRVEAISVEGGDVKRRQSAPPSDDPLVIGYSAAGTVDAVGGAVTRVRPGDRVATFGWAGSHAELTAVPESFVFPVPDGVDLATAATVPVAFGTADDALVEFGRVRAGEIVLVRGATGGVGLAAVQLARAAGAIVIATASGAERAAALSRLGADHVVDGRAPDLVGRLRALTGGHGVDLLVELVGGEGTTELLAAMAPRGRISVVGLGGAGRVDVDLRTLLMARVSLHGVLLGAEMHLDRVHDGVARHLRAIAAGRLTMPVDRVLPLASAAEAHAHMENGRPFGRVVLRP